MSAEEDTGAGAEPDTGAGAEPDTGVARSGPVTKSHAASFGLGHERPDRHRVPAATVLTPPVALVAGLTVLALVLNASRLGLDLAGGALPPVGGLDQVWRTYLASWHGIGGGTAGPAGAALAVLGVLGAVLVPLGGPAALVSALLLVDIPLAALVAYLATRRVPVSRWSRVALAAAYGLLPAATAGVAQGRLGVVVAHVLLPALLAGLAAVLLRTDARWLSTTALCALGLGVLVAFSPIGAVLLLGGVLTGFVVIAPPCGRSRRRALALVMVVLVPPVLVLPWLPVPVTRLGVFWHGVGSPMPEAAGLVELLALDPGGPGALPVGAVVVAAGLATLARPAARLLPGVGLVLLGAVGVATLSAVEVAPPWGGPAAPGYTGVPLLIVGAGLLSMVLAALVPSPTTAGNEPAARIGARAASTPVDRRRFVPVCAVVLVGTLAVGAVLVGGQGPLRPDGGLRLAPSVAAELARTGRSVLVLDPVPRQVAGRAPRFGDDTVLADAGAVERVRDLAAAVRGGAPGAVATAAASGIAFLVLPRGRTGQSLRRASPGLVAPAPATSDGRAVLRLRDPLAPVALLPPEQAWRALDGAVPGTERPPGAVSVPVRARPPEVALRVSDGPEGRALVLAARSGPGWSAAVDGEDVAVRAVWGGQVAVPVPAHASEVTVTRAPGTHEAFLLAQLAALLFTVLTAVPSRRPASYGGTKRTPGGTDDRGVAAAAQPPSMMSGSTPR